MIDNGCDVLRTSKEILKFFSLTAVCSSAPIYVSIFVDLCEWYVPIWMKIFIYMCLIYKRWFENLVHFPRPSAMLGARRPLCTLSTIVYLHDIIVDSVRSSHREKVGRCDFDRNGESHPGATFIGSRTSTLWPPPHPHPQHNHKSVNLVWFFKQSFGSCHSNLPLLYSLLVVAWWPWVDWWGPSIGCQKESVNVRSDSIRSAIDWNRVIVWSIKCGERRRNNKNYANEN